MGKLQGMLAACIRRQEAGELDRRMEKIMGFYIRPCQGAIIIGKGGRQLSFTQEQAEGLEKMLACQLKAGRVSEG